MRNALLAAFLLAATPAALAQDVEALERGEECLLGVGRLDDVVNAEGE